MSCGSLSVVFNLSREWQHAPNAHSLRKGARRSPLLSSSLLLLLTTFNFNYGQTKATRTTLTRSLRSALHVQRPLCTTCEDRQTDRQTDRHARNKREEIAIAPLGRCQPDSWQLWRRCRNRAVSRPGELEPWEPRE